MTYILDFVKRISNIKGFIVLFVLFILFLIIPDFVKEAPISLPKFHEITNGTKILDQTFNYTPDEAYDMLESYGEKGRDYYLFKILLLLDIMIPVIYSLFNAVLLTIIFKKIFVHKWIDRFIIIALMAGVVDYIENVFEIILVVNYPTRLDIIARVSNILTLTKSLLTGLSYILIICGLVLLCINKIRKEDKVD